jgi:hypothetical protein
MGIISPKWKYGPLGRSFGRRLITAMVGLKWGGWEAKNSAQALAQQQVNAALMKALTPICMMSFQKMRMHPPNSGTEENRYIVGPAVLHQRRQMGRDPNEQVTRVVDACPVGPGGDDAAKTYVRSVQIGSTINPAARAP